MLDARFDAAGAGIVALQADIRLPAGVAAGGPSAWRCSGNPFLRQRAFFQRHDCTGNACRTARALLYGFGAELPPLPEGMTLFTCRVAVAQAARPGIGELTVANASASDAAGRRIPLSAHETVVNIRTR